MAAWHSVAGQWVSRETALLLVLMATLPLWIGPVDLYQYLGIEIAIWMIYGLGYNLLLGYSGLPSFGHGAFFGIGAYAFGLFQLRVFESLWLGMFCAIVAAAVAGAFVACFLSHRRGIYFALLTIAFGQVFWFVAIKWHAVTGGEDGLLNIPRPALELGVVSPALSANADFFYFVLFVLAVVTRRQLAYNGATPDHGIALRFLFRRSGLPPDRALAGGKTGPPTSTAHPTADNHDAAAAPFTAALSGDAWRARHIDFRRFPYASQLPPLPSWPLGEARQIIESRPLSRSAGSNSAELRQIFHLRVV